MAKKPKPILHIMSTEEGYLKPSATHRLHSLLEDVEHRGFDRALSECRRCRLWEGSDAPVHPVGNPDSRFVFVGKSPSRRDVLRSRPFHPSAPEGRYLSSLCDVLTLSREDVYITNAAFCRPFCTTIREGELNACSFWKILEFRKLKKADFIFLMGNDAAHQYLGGGYNSVIPIRLHCFYNHRDRQLVFPIPHPAYLLRNPRSWKIIKENLTHYRKVMYLLMKKKLKIEKLVKDRQLDLSTLGI